MQRLYGILNALNKISVRGSENLDLLLGSIQTLRAYIAEQEAADGNKEA